MLGGGVIGIIVYALLLAYPQTSEDTMKVTAFLGVAALLAILAWIGWTMATTPPPEPITEIPSPAEPAPHAEKTQK